MPPRWPRKPDRQDPKYRRLDDIMNFAIHVALFAAVNSGLWFVEMIKDTHWSWRLWFTGAWFGILILHLIYIKAIADYSSANSNG
jgi:integral membrane sensor domain MASE1